MLKPLPEEEGGQEEQQRPRLEEGSFRSSSGRSSSFRSCSGDAQLDSATSSRSTSCEACAPRSGLGSRGRGGGGSTASLSTQDGGSVASSSSSSLPSVAAAVSASSVSSLGFTRRTATIRKLVPERRGAKAALEQRYRVSAQELGKGGYGTVFVAEDREVPGRRVAVKKILATGASKRRAFDHEVDLMKQLDHPSIGRILETYANGRVLCFVMEHCSGGDVFDRVASRGPLDEATAADVMRQVASALHHAHALGIAHRDIKPENVCFCSANRADTSVKVIDWGAGFRFREGSMRNSVGSFAYAAPEMRYAATGYTEACDMWSLGVMIYVVLCGMPPFWGTYENQIKNMNAEHYPLSDARWQKVSDDAKDLIRKLIRAKPEQRLTAEQALAHPWLVAARSKKEIPDSISRQVFGNLRLFATSSSPCLATFAGAVVKQLDHRSLQDLRSVFDSLDVNGAGAISFDALRKGFEAAFEAGSAELQDLPAVFAALDPDSSGAVGYTEFLAAALGEGACAKDEALLAAFKDFDVNDEVRQELSHVIASSASEGKSQPEGGLTLEDWLRRVREPHRRQSGEPLPFEAKRSASSASKCTASFFSRACAALSRRDLDDRTSSTPFLAVQASLGSAHVMPYRGMLMS